MHIYIYVCVYGERERERDREREREREEETTRFADAALKLLHVVLREVGGWGRVPFSRNLMSPTPRRKWYLTTGRRFH